MVEKTLKKTGIREGFLEDLADFMANEVNGLVPRPKKVGVYSSIPEYNGETVVGFGFLVDEKLKNLTRDSGDSPKVLFDNLDGDYSFDLGHYLSRGTMPPTV